MAYLLAIGLIVSSTFTVADDDTDDAPAPAVLAAPHEYLYDEYPVLARKLDCIIRHESTWNQWATNGKYAGLAQFDYPTWMETPQGQAGQSRFDPYAAIDALAWGWTHLGSGRWTTARLC